jgi:hypothetical protein
MTTNQEQRPNQEQGLDEEGPSMKSQRSWESMRVSYLGNVAEVVQQGGGKITAPNIVDPGEPRKVSPTG